MNKFFLFLGLVSCSLLYAQEVPLARSYVTDQAGVFNEREIASLENSLQTLADTSSNEIAVFTIADLGNYDVFDLSLAFARKNKVGSAKHNNGIVILIKPKNEAGKGRVHIQVGTGLEGAIPDAITKRIIELEMIPRFKEGNYFAGTVAAVETLGKFASGEYNEKNYRQKDKDISKAGALIIVGLIIFFVALFARGNKNYAGRNNLGFWMAMSMFSSMGSSHRGRYDRFSGGGGSGGFGGFGGGSFGGGGAGGSW